MYAPVILLLLKLLHINIQPFKKTAVSWYSSIDPVFLLILCIMYTSIVGSDIGGHAHLSEMIVLVFLAAFIPVIYIMFLTLPTLDLGKRIPEEHYCMQIANSESKFSTIIGKSSIDDHDVE